MLCSEMFGAVNQSRLPIIALREINIDAYNRHLRTMGLPPGFEKLILPCFQLFEKRRTNLHNLYSAHYLARPHM